MNTSCKSISENWHTALDDIPHAGESWEVTEHIIQDAFMRRRQTTIAAWEEKKPNFILHSQICGPIVPQAI